MQITRGFIWLLILSLGLKNGATGSARVDQHPLVHGAPSITTIRIWLERQPILHCSLGFSVEFALDFQLTTNRKQPIHDPIGILKTAPRLGPWMMEPLPLLNDKMVYYDKFLGPMYLGFDPRMNILVFDVGVNDGSARGFISITDAAPKGLPMIDAGKAANRSRHGLRDDFVVDPTVGLPRLSDVLHIYGKPKTVNRACGYVELYYDVYHPFKASASPAIRMVFSSDGRLRAFSVIYLAA